MSEPFLAEIRIVGFNFAPRGWAFCDGQILPINQNQSLYSLLGTTYGGDGRTSFALPDMRGRTPVHVGTGVGADHPQGQKSGQESVALAEAEMPSHRHDWRANDGSGNNPIPIDNRLASFNNGYRGGQDLINMQSDTLSSTGSGTGHNNMQPYLALSFCIALQGLFPSRN